MRYICTIIAIVMLTSCQSSANRALLETNKAQYQKDLSHCVQYADQIYSATQIARRQNSIGLFGGLLASAADGANSDTRLKGRGVSAGGAEGAIEVEADKAKVVGRCLKSRGYLKRD